MRSRPDMPPTAIRVVARRSMKFSAEIGGRSLRPGDELTATEWASIGWHKRKILQDTGHVVLEIA